MTQIGGRTAYKTREQRTVAPLFVYLLACSAGSRVRVRPRPSSSAPLASAAPSRSCVRLPARPFARPVLPLAPPRPPARPVLPLPPVCPFVRPFARAPAWPSVLPNVLVDGPACA